MNWLRISRPRNLRQKVWLSVDIPDASRSVKPPVQSIAQATFLRDKLAVTIAELIVDYERATHLRVDGVAVSRGTKTNYLREVSTRVHIAVLVRLPPTAE